MTPNPSFLHLFREPRRFLLSGHENPDGDCVGAQAALFHLLKALGRPVVILNPDPLERSYDFLLDHTEFRSWQPGATVPEFDTVVLLDCHQTSRLGPLGGVLAARRPTLVVIDHHLGSDQGEEALRYVDPAAPSTGTLVHRLYHALEVPLPRAAAEGVFLSLVADTGWFRYSNTSAEVFAIAASLVQAGVDPSRLFDLMFRRNHPDSVGLLADALGTHQYRFGGRYVFAVLDRAFQERAAKAGFNTDDVLEPMRSVQGVEVVALLKERSTGQVKVSLRAVGDVDVQAIAARFGGGGHRKAAGATLDIDLANAIAQVEDTVRRALTTGGAGARTGPS
ncbi:MAG: bifunctional oligoribonuclease/PAP phosphatase NrnA [Planctomycetes bacterium]|nr:bifunctional oligoribonuclease/PAP phosphatase NrnA [Planctomycetota bacterium]